MHLWQFIQRGEKEYCVKLQLKDESELEAIVQEVRKIVGEDATVNIEKVDEIPVLRSGKRKPVICEWKK